MRVAYVCADAGVPLFGSKGCSIHVQEMIRAMRAQGLEVEAFVFRLGDCPPADLRTLPIHEIPLSPSGDPDSRERALLASNVALQGLLSRLGPFDLVYERYSLWSYAGIEYAERCGTPCFLEVNSPLLEEQHRHRVLKNRELAARVTARVFGGPQTLVAVSEDVGRYLEQFSGTSSRVLILPNGVDAARFSPLVEPIGRRPGHFTVGFAGSLKPWHDLKTLIVAFSSFQRAYPASRLLIVGDGPERDRVLDWAQHYGVSQSLEFTGPVSPTEVPAWLTSMDVGVAPYPAQYGCYFSPLKLYEYLSSGLATVASDVGQISGVIRNRHNGLLYPAGDSEGLCRALFELVSQPALTRQLGINGRKTILAGGHTWSDNVRRILDRAGNGLPALAGKGENP